MRGTIVLSICLSAIFIVVSSPMLQAGWSVGSGTIVSDPGDLVGIDLPAGGLQEKLSVNGGILLGTTALTNDGTIHYDGSDLQGYVNGAWHSLTNDGDWTIGSASLSTTRSVGIGITSPSCELDVVQDNTGSPTSPPVLPMFRIRQIDPGGVSHVGLTVLNNGSVGVGTENPQGKLNIDGVEALIIENNSSPVWENTIAKLGISTNLGPQGLRFEMSGDNGTSFVDALHLARNGNVGIGTTDPKGYKLAVRGNVICESIKVKLYASWPDFVFEEDYQRPSLEELARFVSVNKHLPDIPSAAAMNAADGVDLGAMQVKLLQKIEELTLYLIELNKSNADVQAENAALRVMIEELQAQLTE